MNVRFLVLMMLSNFLIFGAYATENECSVPGEELSREPVGFEPRWSKNHTFSRSVSKKFSYDFKAQHSFETAIDRVFAIETCKETSKLIDIEVCSTVDPERAKGQGNSLYRIFFNTEQGSVLQATLFYDTLTFARDLDTART